MFENSITAALVENRAKRKLDNAFFFRAYPEFQNCFRHNTFTGGFNRIVYHSKIVFGRLPENRVREFMSCQKFWIGKGFFKNFSR